MKKFSKNYCSNILLVKIIFIGILISLPLNSAFSENKKQKPAVSKKDFGAETVEPLEETKPLPPSLAEEKLNNKTTAAKEDDDEQDEDDQTEDLKEVKNSFSKKNPQNTEEESNASLTTSLNGNEIEVATLVKTFSKITKRNYIVDNNVKGKVAIHLATPVSIPESLRIFESVLLLKGFTTVPMGNNTWKVISAKDARQTTIPMLSATEDKNSEALVTQLIRLKNTQAADLQQVLTQFVSKEGLINSFAATNSLIVIDTASNIKRLTKLISELDVPALDQDLTIIPIQHAEAKDLAEKINNILGSDKEGTESNTATKTVPAIDPTKANLTNASLKNFGASEKRQLPLKLIPDERTNSIIVVADSLLTEKVKALVEQLDSTIDRSGGRFYVYRLQHADAEEMAQIIGNLISGSSGPSTSTSSVPNSRSSRNRSSSSSSSSSFSPSSRNRSSQDSDSGNSGTSRSSTNTRTSGQTFSSGDGGKVSLDGEVSVAADVSTNSLIISASKSDYLKIKELIDSLDIKRQQVLVEATILEVSLDNTEGMGFELQSTAGTDKGGVFGQTNFGGITNLLTNPKALSDLTIAAASSGSIVLPGGIVLPSQALLVSALSNNSNVNVLSAPTILATDNQEAEIKVGENVPFVTGTAQDSTNTNSTFNQIERQDVGIKLRITPQISAGNFVVLKIFVEISNVVDGTRGDINGPTTTLRTTETMVEVKSDQMIVTGGLISDSSSDASRGVPFFQEIPILGNLFRKDQNRQKRTNLLVFITPKIIKDQFVAREATLEKRDYIEKIIKEQKATPDRDEVLHRDSLNKVIEVQKLETDLPSTISPAKTEPFRANIQNTTSEETSAQVRTEERIEKIKETTSKKTVVKTEDEVLQFKVKPKLPKVKK